VPVALVDPAGEAHCAGFAPAEGAPFIPPASSRPSKGLPSPRWFVPVKGTHPACRRGTSPVPRLRRPSRGLTRDGHSPAAVLPMVLKQTVIGERVQCRDK
jgi:hypothetical protein